MTGGVAHRRRLAEAGRQAAALGLAPTRADRFRARLGGGPAAVPPSLAQLGGWPTWPRFEPEVQTRLLATVAMVAGRDALAREIDGSRLRAYAGIVGETVLEDVLALPAGGPEPLPAAAHAAETGRRLVRLALPPELARASGVAPVADARAAAWVATAEALVIGQEDAA